MAHKHGFAFLFFLQNLLLLLTFSLPLVNTRRLPRQPLCNTLEPTCGFSSVEAQIKFLTPYIDLLPKLQEIEGSSSIPLEVGPLIRNSDNGLVDIDDPLDGTLPNVNISICGPNTSPTIREAVVCSVRNDAVQPPRGNVDPSRVGHSNNGRKLLGARTGNTDGIRVLVISQQHGNEAASTEAVLSFLRSFSNRPGAVKKILERLHILIIVRANPDGGEPTGETDPSPGRFMRTEGFFRHSVDPDAGGGFANDTEEDFFGVVGRGYDINRYNFFRLNAAIRPVENQAIVAATLAFRPRFIVDMHGDVQKFLCEIDERSIVLQKVAGTLPIARCKPPVSPVPTLLTDRSSTVVGSVFADDSGPGGSEVEEGFKLSEDERLLRALVTRLVRRVAPRISGRLVRLSQIGLQGARLSQGVVHKTAREVGIVGTGFEVLAFVTELRAVVNSVMFLNGTAVPRVGFDTYLNEPCFLQDNICLHELFLREMLGSIRKLALAEKVHANGFCNIPTATGLTASTPMRLGWGNMSIEEEKLIPMNASLGVPLDISGTCPKSS